MNLHAGQVTATCDTRNRMDPESGQFGDPLVRLKEVKVGDEMSNSKELVALVALLRYGSFQKSQMALRQRLIDGDLPSQILAEESNSELIHENAIRDVDQWILSGERPLSWLDADYPQQLREVHDFPPVIFVRGQLAQADHGVCIVGSRDAGLASIEAAREIAQLVVDKGWTVVSGLVGLWLGLATALTAITRRRTASCSERSKNAAWCCLSSGQVLFLRSTLSPCATQ